jgi:hypothetical protein
VSHKYSSSAVFVKPTAVSWTTNIKSQEKEKK